MAKEKVVVYGLTTEGYFMACQMAIKGADVYLVDESSPTAISLKPEVAKNCPDIDSLKEDEPILTAVPVDVAVSKAEYLFFTPRIRKINADLKAEVNSKFKESIKKINKGSTVIYCLATGHLGNSENITILKHVTGFEAGKSVSYYYFPLNGLSKTPSVIGSLKKIKDKKLSALLSTNKDEKTFVDISSAEHIHHIQTVKRFSGICSILEVCKLVKNNTELNTTFNGFQNMYLDDMMNGLDDLRLLSSSFEGSSPLLYLINGSIKGINGYAKRLIEIIRITLKNHDLKASKTKIILSWTLDKNQMRGEKVEMLNSITSKLRDYIGDVETSEGLLDFFHSDKTTIAIACTESDYKKIKEIKQNQDIFLIKANPMFEVSNKSKII